jgi:acetyltransferase-like isoleucine patch superfamily enzyme
MQVDGRPAALRSPQDPLSLPQFVASVPAATIAPMFEERLVPRRTPQSRAITERVQEVMALTSRLNLLPFDDTDTRQALLSEIFGKPLPETVTIYPPFYTDHGRNIAFGERVFVNQGCWFLDMGGITIGDRTMIGPNVTLTTAGHPVALAHRYDGITTRPIVIEADVWIGAGATITPGVTIGYGSVVGAGTVVAKDVPPLTVVTGTSFVERTSYAAAATAAMSASAMASPTAPSSVE